MNNYVTLLSKHRSAIMGFAILWVMLFHLRVSVDFIPFMIIKKIGYGGVDTFLFLSGFGLYYSCSKENFNKRKYYKNRFKRILPEFWLVLVVVFILQKDFSYQSFYALICCASTLGLWVWGVIPYVLWYISCILFFYAPVENTNKPLTVEKKKLFSLISKISVCILTVISCLIYILYDSSYTKLIDVTLIAVALSVGMVVIKEEGSEKNEVNRIVKR